MTFFRLIKPDWGKKTLEKDGAQVPNPDFVKEIPGPSTIEGVLDEKLVAEKNELGYNVYWFPNHPSKDVYSEEKHYLNGRDIDVFNFVFVDMDLKDLVYKDKEDFYQVLKASGLIPTFTIDSGNGVHAYWEVSDLTRDSYVALQKRLIQQFKTDHSVYTVLQLLRYPGSMNTKNPLQFKQTSIVNGLTCQQSYTVSELDAKLFQLTEDNAKKVKSHLDKLDGRVEVKLHDEMNVDELPDRFLNLLLMNERIYKAFVTPEAVYSDRSKADAALANFIFSNNFDRKEAIAILSNTHKALSKGSARLDYAAATASFVYDDRKEYSFKTVAQKLKDDRTDTLGQRIHGPGFLDCTVNGWRNGEMLGIIAGPGVGKTAMALKILQEIIQNNSDKDEIYIFYSLEMPEYEIEERWVKLVGKNSPLATKLYVIGNEDPNGEPRNIGLQQMYWYGKSLMKDTGKKIGAIVVDHVHIVNRSIDTRKSPTFDVESETGNGFGKVRAMSLNKLCDQLRVLTKLLGTFSIILTQTTKGKGSGDTPIGIDGAYGISNYEWNLNAIISLWQPLMRIQKDTELRVLAWQYCKIRGKHIDDPISTYEQQVLTYDMETGNIRPTTGDEYSKFLDLLPQAEEARKANDDKKSTGYSRGPNLSDLKKLKLV